MPAWQFDELWLASAASVAEAESTVQPSISLNAGLPATNLAVK